jgi:hypothetical protein
LNINIPKKVLDEKEIKLIIKAINDSRSELDQHLRDRGFRYNNGKYHDRWNYIFNNIEKNFKNTEFNCYAVNRCALWKFIVLYNVHSKIVYIIFKNSTFHGINKRHNTLYHYARILNSINLREAYQNDTIAVQQRFSSLEDNMTLSDLTSNVNQQLDDMIGEIQREARLCVNILFEENNNLLTSISGNIANYNLEIRKTYNWDKFITPTVEEIMDTESITNEYDENKPPIDLKIRKEKLKYKKTDNIVGEKGKDTKKYKNDGRDEK